MQAQRGIGGIAPLILNFGARWEWVRKATPRPISPGDRAPVTIIQEAGSASESVCMSLEKRKSLSPAKFESPVAYRGGRVWGVQPPPPKFRRSSKIVPNSTRFVKTVKNC